LSEEDWALGLAVNLTGVFLLAKYSMPEIIKAGGGSFVAVASAAGHNALANNAANVAAKNGAVGLVKTMAMDYARYGVRCNVVCPGFIETAMVRSYLVSAPEGERERRLSKIPAGRFGKPEEIASAIAHLISAEASYVNGVAHMVDGGAYAGYLPPDYRAS
jgi:NAD(P)-dependent dehydrogenase (short-subunit alcohol dehydrogenase family)